MDHVQKWFEKIAGITHEDCARLEFARMHFGKQPFNASTLQKPACWRRKVKFNARPGMALRNR